MFQKKLLVILLAANSFLPGIANASGKDFVFVYTQELKDKRKVFEFKASDMTYREALRVASHACMDHFSGNNLGGLTESQQLDLVDLCANPRTR